MVESLFQLNILLKPPTIRMTTPSGRFQPDTRLCLTMSDFHPSSWNPSWSVSTILNGLLSFMVRFFDGILSWMSDIKFLFF